MVEKLEQENIELTSIDPLKITFESTNANRPKKDRVDWQPDTTNGKKVFEYIDKLWWKWKITVGKSLKNQYDIRVQKWELIESTGEIQRKTQKYSTWIIANDEKEFSESLLRILDKTIWTVKEGKRGRFRKTPKKIFNDLSEKEDTLWNDNNTKKEYNKTEIKEIFDIKDKIIDLSWSWKKWQDKRYNNYLLNNEFRNANYLWPEQRKKVIDWFCRMVESKEINMIFKMADKYKVPRQCIYLALAESGRQAWANSWVATWYRQFTKQSALDFGLNKKWWPDNRWKAKESTEAAMKHLKANYDIVCTYAKQLDLNDKLSENDKWYLAFSMFNWSPSIIKSGMKACKWNINEYATALVELAKENGGYINGKKFDASQNANYMPRILAIERILEEAFMDNDYDIQKVKLSESKITVPEHKETEADIMYKNYFKKAKNLTPTQKIEELYQIMEKYYKEQQKWDITKKYYEWAISAIENILASFKKSWSDTRFELFEKRWKYLSVEQKITALNEIAKEYDQEYAKWKIDEKWHAWAIKVIQAKIKELEKLK